MVNLCFDNAVTRAMGSELHVCELQLLLDRLYWYQVAIHQPMTYALAAFIYFPHKFCLIVPANFPFSSLILPRLRHFHSLLTLRDQGAAPHDERHARYLRFRTARTVLAIATVSRSLLLWPVRDGGLWRWRTSGVAVFPADDCVDNGDSDLSLDGEEGTQLFGKSCIEDKQDCCSKGLGAVRDDGFGLTWHRRVGYQALIRASLEPGGALTRRALQFEAALLRSSAVSTLFTRYLNLCSHIFLMVQYLIHLIECRHRDAAENRVARVVCNRFGS